MSKQLIHLILLAVMLSLVSGTTAYSFGPGTDPSLIGWWRFDEGAGLTANDSSGNGHTGTLTNGPVWTVGVLSKALQFDGVDDYVLVPHDPSLTVSSEVTVAVWINAERYNAPNGEAWQGIIGKQEGQRSYNLYTEASGALHFSTGGVGDLSNPVLPLNEWVHACAMVVNGTHAYFINGEPAGTAGSGITLPGTADTADVVIGRTNEGVSRSFLGMIDDVRIYNRALTQEEVQIVMKGESAATASSPNPGDSVTDVRRDVVLSWTPGPFAATHDVYFGANFDDVNAAGTANPLGVLVGQGQGENTYDPTDLLAFSQTYYWRVDEVNAAPDNTIFKGEVWSFTVEPALYPVQGVVATASLPSSGASGEVGATVDGSGLTDGQHSTADPAMWVVSATPGEPVWLQYDFDRVYKLYGIHVWNYNGMYEMFLGFGLKDVTIEYATEPNEWMPLGDFQLDRAPGRVTYAGQTIDLDGIAARSVRINVNSSQSGGSSYGLSEIQFLQKPVFAREPNPTDGATDVSRAASLSWRPGREAASHQVHFGTDSNAVADGAALVATVSTATYNPGALNLGTTYYWKVDEVNDAESPSVWDSDVWSFTTQEFVPIDNFDSYTDEDGSRIFDVWLDGYGITTNGSLVGHENPPYAEKTNAHSGQAMPLYYNNTAGVANSEAELALTPAQDWTANGADTLSLYYRGNPTGFSQVSESNVIMNGTGTDIWGTTDEFRFVYKQLTGNGSIIARVEYLDYTNEWAKAGVMIRQSLDSDSALVDGMVSASRRVCMQWRTGRGVDMNNPDASTHTVIESFTFPHWVKLTRTGDVFTVQRSLDGVTWIDIVPETAGDPLSITVVMPQTVYIGLAVTSHAAGSVAGSQFTGVATTGNVTGQWQSASIGVDQPVGNGIDVFYLAVEDSSGKKVTLTNPSIAAVAMGSYQQWVIPLSDITAAGVKANSVTKLYLGVGDRTKPSQNASGVLYIDDIAFGHPIE